MAHKTLIGGTAYEVKGGRTLVGGTGYDIAKGRALVDGTGYDINFGLVAGNLEVGSSVYGYIDGVKTEFIVVHKGNPDAAIYDEYGENGDLLDGTWVLMKDVYTTGRMNSTSASVAAYGSSTSNSNVCSQYLNNDFVALVDASFLSAINVLASLPYKYGSASNLVYRTADQTFFPPSAYELGFTDTNEYHDGVCFDYFKDAANADRIAYLDGTADEYWTRTAVGSSADRNLMRTVKNTGEFGSRGVDNSYSFGQQGYRPMCVLNKNAIIDPNTFEVLGL